MEKLSKTSKNSGKAQKVLQNQKSVEKWSKKLENRP